MLKYATFFRNMRKIRDSPETMRKLCLSAKFPYQEIRWNYGILGSETINKAPSRNKVKGNIGN